MKFIITEDVSVEFPGLTRTYKKGDVVTVTPGDVVTAKGLYVCFGHGAFTLIPVRNLLKINEEKQA